MNLSGLHETYMQPVVHRLLSDPSIIRTTKNGSRLQVLSPGRINVHEGPDFLEVALLINGCIIIGDAEFHKKNSSWLSHGHGNDPAYNNVILHIVLSDDNSLNFSGFETLVLDTQELDQAYTSEEKDHEAADINSLEDLQHYALVRLLRKTVEAQKLINLYGREQAFIMLTGEYINKYNGRRRRPVYQTDKLGQLVSSLPDSKALEFLNDLFFGSQLHIPDRMQMLLKSKFSEEGAHLRREIILNCVLPLSLCLANEESRISLFLWYWSTPALHAYGVLKRRFREFPQNFLWQQQGMLEYIKENGRKQNVVADSIKGYGFAEILSFYRLGRAPFASYTESEQD